MFPKGLPSGISRTGRLALTVALAVYGLVILLRPSYRLLDSLDLAIHETGHLVFGPFGEFVGFLGGTLMQLIIPMAFLVYFFRQGDRHAASVVLWWVGQNFWNIAVYVRDARAQALPLVGSGDHDWSYLLGRLGVLEYDQVLGRGIHAVGVLVFGYSIIWGIIAARARLDRTANR